jgi:hypothetical protein
MMLKGTEELKMVLDLAASNGRKEVENEMLESRNKQLLGLLDEKDKQLVEKDKTIEDLNQRIRDMEALISNKADNADGQRVVLINQYILLDAPKTVNYVCALDNAQKMFAGHMLLHTMAASTPKQIYDKVNEITQLEKDPTERLINSMEKVAERPTYNYESGATHYDKRSQLLLGEESEKIV